MAVSDSIHRTNGIPLHMMASCPPAAQDRIKAPVRIDLVFSETSVHQAEAVKGSVEEVVSACFGQDVVPIAFRHGRKVYQPAPEDVSASGSRQGIVPRAPCENVVGARTEIRGSIVGAQMTKELIVAVERVAVRRFIDVKPVPGEQYRQAREPGFEPPGKTVEGLEFTVLFINLFIRVFDELGHQRESESVGRHQFCLKHLMVVNGFAVALLGKTVGAMASSIGDCSGAVDGDQEIPVQDAVSIEDFLAYEHVHH